MTAAWTPVPQLGFGQVVHARTRPARHQFQYGTYFLLLPMRTHALPSAAWDWQPNRAGALSFRDEDHGAGVPATQGGALPWLLALLAAHGLPDTGGDIWLQTYPRVWGYSFKPVSFWYCFDKGAEGELRAVVAEVNNTFGERHCYVLRAPQWGQTVQADKQFHVSPFCEVQGHYAFCFERQNQDGKSSLSARVDYHDAQGLLLHTRITGALQPLNAAVRRKALWAYPLMTLGVVWHIHRQAFALWRKRVPFFSKPEPPLHSATLSRPETP
ncbi:DUF1365 domain-containing protein [Curvibacter sp. APW13]|uniref:DUF1365 domain-containing protein n=1 Tax=Curvibacter sp. APW13 TaxID=3077236 RepID=UPI0028DF8B66|nr:DUF1365 domain-containing protein [Curvibacter sp. APW13]MDT8990415.1 DUF1365 domain-containing protein [Curvibacter sp. APW13]